MVLPHHLVVCRNHFEEDHAGVLERKHYIDPTRYIERKLVGCIASRGFCCSFVLWTTCLQKRCISVLVYSIFRPLGQYTEQTNEANAVRISSATSVLSNSVLSARVLLLSAFRKALNKVFLPVPENLPISSAPVKAWKADKAFALSSHRANHTGRICTIPTTKDTDVVFASKTPVDGKLLWSILEHLYLERRS